MLRDFEWDFFIRITSTVSLGHTRHPLLYPWTLLITLTMVEDDTFTVTTTWSSFLAQIYTTGRRPINGSYDYYAVEEKAREVTKDNHCMY